MRVAHTDAALAVDNTTHSREAAKFLGAQMRITALVDPASIRAARRPRRGLIYGIAWLCVRFPSFSSVVFGLAASLSAVVALPIPDQNVRTGVAVAVGLVSYFGWVGVTPEDDADDEIAETTQPFANVLENLEQRVSPQQRINSTGANIGGVAIGYLLSRLVNPVLAVHGFSPAELGCVDTVCAAGGGYFVHLINKNRRYIASMIYEPTRRRAVEKKSAALRLSFKNITDFAEVQRFYTKFDEHLREYRAGLLTATQREHKIHEMYDDYLITLGEEPVNRKRKRRREL